MTKIKISAEDFRALYGAACDAVRKAVGVNWHLYPAHYRYGRVPAAVVSIKVLGKTKGGRRDLRLPNAEYWPGGALPPIAIDLANRQTQEPPRAG